MSLSNTRSSWWIKKAGLCARDQRLRPARADGALNVPLNRTALATGKYKLRLFGSAGTDEETARRIRTVGYRGRLKSLWFAHQDNGAQKNGKPLSRIVSNCAWRKASLLVFPACKWR